MDRIAVFLNGFRGLSVLKALIVAGHSIESAVVPAKADVGHVRSKCEDLGVSVHASVDVNNDPAVAALKPRLSIIAGFSTIFKRPLLELAELGTLNLHAGRLPQYQGGSPLNWQIINGEAEACCSVIFATEEIDMGDIAAEAVIPIGPNDTIADLHDRANPVFARLTVEVVDALDRGVATRSRQNQAEAVYWHQRSDADGRIDWRNMTAAEVDRLVRAVTKPYRGAHAMLGNDEVRVWSTEVPIRRVRGVPGRVCWIEGKGPYIVCRDRAILLTDYSLSGDARLTHGSHLS